MSSKTPENNDAKTASEPKQKQHKRPSVRSMLATALSVIAAVAIAGLVISMLFLQKKPSDCSEKYRQDKTITIRDHEFQTQLADNDGQRLHGLSGRSCIGSNQAMLFVFDTAGKNCFWMKDMKFNIDMVWLDEQKNVIGVVNKATPDSYPKTFCPSGSAKYGLEFKAGTVENLEMTEGDKAQF